MKITSKIPMNHSITEVPFTKEKKRGFLPAFFLSFFLAPVLLFWGEWILKTSSLILLAIACISLYILKTRESIHIRFHHFFGIISGFLLFLLSFFPSYFSMLSISFINLPLVPIFQYSYCVLLLYFTSAKNGSGQYYHSGMCPIREKSDSYFESTYGLRTPPV